MIADFDIYHQVGGGQTFYRRIIETNPDIDFCYLVIAENINHHLRPANAQVFTFKQSYFKSDLEGINLNLLLEKIGRPFLLACNIAHSVEYNYFDLIDYPDYEQYGLFLGSALAYHQVKFNKIVLSLHGAVSRSLNSDWYVDKNYVNNLEFVEDLQYQLADIRYGISKDYLEKWQQNITLPNYYLHPFNFLNLTVKNRLKNTYKKPILNFVGRKEKGKGVDIFVNMVSFLPEYLYSSANIIGSNTNVLNGKTGEYYLQEMLNFRLSKIKVLPSINRPELETLFMANSVTILPSRVDSLDLVALESLFSGCPTVIGNKAGVCRFLEDNFPALSWLKLNVDNFYDSLPDIIELLTNYDDYRSDLERSLSDLKFEYPLTGLKLVDIYNQSSNFSEKLRVEYQQYYQQLIDYCQAKQYFGKTQLTATLKTIVKPIVNYSKTNLNHLKNQLKSGRQTWQTQLIKSLFLSQEFNRITNLPETTAGEIDTKLSCLVNLSQPLQPLLTEGIDKFKTGNFLNRLQIWQAIARLEKIRGNHLLAASYEIRIIRLLGEDRDNQLNKITQILNRDHFSQEAQVLNLLYQANPDRAQLCQEYLLNQYQTHLDYQQKPWEFIDDYREAKNYRVSTSV